MKYIKQCPTCGRDQRYNRADHLRIAVANNTQCYSCHAKKVNTDHRPIGDIISSRLQQLPNGCTIYVGTHNKDGYGLVKRQLAHRIWWKLHNGHIPNRMCVLHSCDNPPCCNLSHLFLGTRADNVYDCHKKGRSRGGSNKGVKNGNHHSHWH